MHRTKLSLGLPLYMPFQQYSYLSWRFSVVEPGSEVFSTCLTSFIWYLYIYSLFLSINVICSKFLPLIILNRITNLSLTFPLYKIQFSLQFTMSYFPETCYNLFINFSSWEFRHKPALSLPLSFSLSHVHLRTSSGSFGRRIHPPNSFMMMRSRPYKGK